MVSLFVGAAHAFCGHYVGSVDDELYNHAAKAYLVRQGTRTSLTLKNEYEGDAANFAMLLPVPQILHEEDVAIVDAEVLDRVDTYTAPRLVEYYCQQYDSGYWWGYSGYWYTYSYSYGTTSTVVVHDRFLVGAYDVVILSAQQSSGLLAWLDQNGYATSSDSRALLQDYIDRGSYFLAAKVALGQTGATGFLEPLRLTYESGELGLPIRLGTLNAGGCDQDLVVTVITDAAAGRVEIANVPEVDVPDECLWDDDDFADVSALYEYSFSKVMNEQPGMAYVTEYSWPSSSCDPCPAGALTTADVNELGFRGDVWESHTTRLHLRYDPAQVTEELRMSTTGDRSTKQMRYVVDDGAHRAEYPVCERGWDPAPLDCDGAVVAPGGTGPFVEGPLPPPPPAPTSCPLPRLDPPSGTPDPTKSGFEPASRRGCGCDGTAGGGGLVLGLLALGSLRRRR